MAKKAKVSKKKKQTKVRKKMNKKKDSSEGSIVIDEKENLVFSSEEELYSHFQPVIEKLEKYFFEKRNEGDIPVESYTDFEECLPLLLEEPFEVWQDDESFDGEVIYNFIGEFEDEEHPDVEPIFYLAQV